MVSERDIYRAAIAIYVERAQAGLTRLPSQFAHDEMRHCLTAARMMAAILDSTPHTTPQETP